MILVDTNVVSETMRARPDPNVTMWLDNQVVSTLFLSSVSLAELLLGVAVLPTGRRKDDLEMTLNAQIDLIFRGRILPLDEAAARAYARLVALARSIGRTVSIPDGQIAAIATVRGMKVATRDITPFVVAGVEIINPWSHPPVE